MTTKTFPTTAELTEKAQARGWFQGTQVRCGEFPGAIVRHYYEDMWEVRLPGGVACVSGGSLVVTDPRVVREG